MVGDNYQTDIQAGIQYGIHADGNNRIFNLKHLEKWKNQPPNLVSDLSERTI